MWLFLRFEITIESIFCRRKRTTTLQPPPSAVTNLAAAGCMTREIHGVHDMWHRIHEPRHWGNVEVARKLRTEGLGTWRCGMSIQNFWSLGFREFSRYLDGGFKNRCSFLYHPVPRRPWTSLCTSSSPLVTGDLIIAVILSREDQTLNMLVNHCENGNSPETSCTKIVDAREHVVPWVAIHGLSPKVQLKEICCFRVFPWENSCPPKWPEIEGEDEIGWNMMNKDVGTSQKLFYLRSHEGSLKK